MRMDPFLRAKATSSSSCCRVAAAPVGLLGLQKKIRSVAFTCTSAVGAQDVITSGRHARYRESGSV